MNTTFMLDGGAGRIICAIPALEQYHRDNPQDDFKVLVSGWGPLYLGHPLLHDRVFPAEEPGSFRDHIYPNRCVSPEPYRLYEYYHDRVSMAEAFDIIINGRPSCSEYKPNLYINFEEDKRAILLLEDLKLKTGKDKVVVINPFGSSCYPDDATNRVLDASGRSIPSDVYDRIVDKIRKEAAVLYFGLPEPWSFTSRKSHHIFEEKPSLRDYMALIANSDYFIGCDSVGQHMARSFNKPGLILMGATEESNVSYPDYDKFTIYRKSNVQREYPPLRLSPGDCQVADQINEKLMHFSNKEIDRMVKVVLDQLNG